MKSLKFVALLFTLYLTIPSYAIRIIGSARQKSYCAVLKGTNHVIQFKQYPDGTIEGSVVLDNGEGADATETGFTGKRVKNKINIKEKKNLITPKKGYTYSIKDWTIVKDKKGNESLQVRYITGYKNKKAIVKTVVYNNCTE
jgi:hypothetical protein